MRKLMTLSLLVLGAIGITQAVTLEGRLNEKNQLLTTEGKGFVANIPWKLTADMAKYVGKVVRVTGPLNTNAAYTTFNTVDSVEVIGE